MMTAILVFQILTFLALCSIYTRLGEIYERYKENKEDRELRKRAIR